MLNLSSRIAYQHAYINFVLINIKDRNIKYEILCYLTLNSLNCFPVNFRDIAYYRLLLLPSHGCSTQIKFSLLILISKFMPD